jgi:amino acid adenylation domain-containing protein
VSADLKERLASLSDEQRRLLAQRLTRGERSSVRAIGRRERPATGLPLSFAQQRIWFLEQVAALNLAFNIAEINRLRGPLDVATIQLALTEIVRRHEVLRTTFVVRDGQPAQVIAPVRPVPVEVEDLRGPGLAETDRATRAIERLLEVNARPWELHNGPLIRAHVWHLADDDHVLMILLHHIVSDGWSKNVLVRELVTLVQAFSRGEPSPLPELPIQYGDFALWQRESIDNGQLAPHVEYWKRQLADAATLKLPTDRTPASGTAGLHRWTLISPELKERLRAVGQQSGATPFMVLLAAFATLLSRYCGDEDIVIGSPFANRHWSEVEGLIGCFMNPLPLRVDLGGNPTFRTLVGRVRETALGAYAHQDVPFDLIVRSVPSSRDNGQSPLFQALFLLQNFDWQELTLAGSGLDRQSMRFTAEQMASVDEREHAGDLTYPVALEIIDAGDRLAACFQYAPQFARLFANAPAHLRSLLEAVVENPDIRVGDVALLTEDERTALVANHACAARRAYPIQPVPRLFEAEVERSAERVAVVADGASITYSALNKRANQIARFLIARGVGPEVRVGLVLERSIDAVAAILAVMKAGGAYLPIDPNYPSDRQAYLLRDAGVRVIVTERRLADRRADLFNGGGSSPTFVYLDEHADAIDGQPPSNLDVAVDPANLAYLIYTSGSTGRPKGTMIAHEGLANAFFAWEEAYGLRQVSAHLQMASISFDVFSGDLVRALCSGGRLVLVPHEQLFNPAELYRLMRDQRVDCAEFVPAVIRELTGYVRQTCQSLDFMRLLIVGSDSWYSSEYAALQSLCGDRTRVVNSYGVSEATIDSSLFETPAIGGGGDAVMPIGRSFANTELFVLDRNLQLAPIGVPGELCIGGPGLARGYHERPDLTAARFVPHPFSTAPGQRLYRTGDRARLLPDGNLELLGRTDQQVKLRGFRIEVGEIESVIAEHRSVAQAAVVLREDTPGDRRLVAYVAPAPEGTLSVPELRQYLRGRVPEYMVPAAIVEMAALPLTPNGKVDRRALPVPDRERQVDTIHVAPSNALEHAIAEIWRDLLRLNTVGVHDNFFDLGGHSLLVVQLHGRLRQRLNLDLTVVDLFTFPTIHALASKFTAAADEENAELDATRRRAARQRDAFRRRRLTEEGREVSL